MYPAPFEYHAPSSVDEAVSLLARYEDDAKLLAGGHSLIPVMKLRFAQPKHLIDLRKVAGLAGIREVAGAIVVGAMTRYAAVERSNLVRGRLPILAEAVSVIGDPLVRSMGTVGGSLAHADPGADLPAVALALEAELIARGRNNRARTIPAREFFRGMLATALEPTEVLTEVRFPIPDGQWGGAYEKHKHPASGYALVGVAAVLTVDGDMISRARVGLTGIGTTPSRAAAVEEALTGQRAGDPLFAEAAERAAEGVDIREDASGDAEYKTALAAAVVRRALRRAAENARP